MKIFFRALPILYMALIWTLSSMPADAIVALPDDALDRFIKESLHLVEFGILYILLFLAGLTFNNFRQAAGFLFMGIAILYGLIDEIHQYFVPNRSATLIDFVKDTIGVLAASHFIHHAYFNNKFNKLGNLLRRFETWIKQGG